MSLPPSAPTTDKPTETTLPAALYASLLGKLAAVLELTQRPEGTTTPQAKQAVLHATNEFKSALTEAKERATRLPGGELRIDEQGEVIDILMELRDRKRQQLAEFSARVEKAGTESRAAQRVGMEVDSMASTPFHEG